MKFLSIYASYRYECSANMCIVVVKKNVVKEQINATSRYLYNNATRVHREGQQGCVQAINACDVLGILMA